MSGRGAHVPAEHNNGLRLTKWHVLCSLTDRLDVSKEGVWLLGPQPDVLNIQRDQEHCGSWGVRQSHQDVHLLRCKATHPPTMHQGFAQLPDALCQNP